MTENAWTPPFTDSHNKGVEQFDTDVAIVGAGPVGTLLAILLGQKGHRVTLVERWPQPYDRPRAVTFDHEIARILASLGIDSDNDPAINYHDELYYWRNAEGEDLLIVDWKSTSASGWRVRYWFYQPDLEKRLLGIAQNTPGVRLIRGWEANALSQDKDGIWLQGRSETSGAPTSLRARYVVGADGANSFVRQALKLSFTDHGFFYDWLILDMIPHEERVLDPVHWQLCDPKRPTTIVPGGPGRLRWEFMALPGESAEILSSPETAWELMSPWGLTPANSTLERSAVYRFQARWAESWRNGRGLIAGDAAHLMPPFAGEGMCAGLRDAVALGWRLDAILSGVMGEEVLDSYTSERREHVKHYIEFSMELGRIICITDPAEAVARDQRMKAELEASDRKPVPTDKASLGPGIWNPDAGHAGELSIQGIVRAGELCGRFDEVVGRGWLVIGYGQSPRQALSAEQVQTLERLDARFVTLGPVGTVCEVADAEGTYAAWLASIDARFLVIRPDFYVAASAASAESLRQQMDNLLLQLHLTPVLPDLEVNADCA
ncbi:bifunctional 3-(3-hydroxy-phenyl)propionate/3-hydroxycinnamic acid hydroxylase [Pseudomonas aeruginosa]|uniref:bifunctional 3-(3-hydroxy-phenyl)propionate/3-hydroxycinnamic acid hydroxylase MhpA n=1 Tax=Pseudomonas aeruginosa TaxID=287 RepID=UPI0022EAEE64|nr:bifunctional 3-(3-hydroxy-phenyl)propionate/3-hydroxycinnamic acid hydroxylase [Pseudomonas aeruginosa]MDA3425349.1 bifunctional 3-(3-hydroxy-phenyl)propionate/3-hydroxycinnamic acid hydroxylase [Pseudomonas aeruginosa]